jgi:hypothetical protein
MSISLRDRIAVPTTLRNTLSISRQDLLVSFGMMLFEPRQQRWTKVETNPRIVPGSSIRRIALRVNPLIPIVKWRRTRLQLDFASPGIFARGLIEVAVDD